MPMLIRVTTVLKFRTVIQKYRVHILGTDETVLFDAIAVMRLLSFAHAELGGGRL